MADFFLFFLGVLWYTLGALVICGLLVALCRRLFVRMMGGGVGRAIVIGTSIVGTPVHELSHALMCLIFRHKIIEMRLWQPASDDGTLGYVSHSYNKRNPYQVLGNLFIGIGPVLGGLGVMTLMLALCFPGALDTYMDSARAVTSGSGAGFGKTFTLILDGLCIFPHMIGEAFTDGGVPVWARILGFLVILSVSLHIELSPADIKGSLSALPLYLILILILTVVCAALGGITGAPVMAKVLSGLAAFSVFLTSLFVLVLAMALLQLVIALPVLIIRKLAKK